MPKRKRENHEGPEVSSAVDNKPINSRSKPTPTARPVVPSGSTQSLPKSGDVKTHIKDQASATSSAKFLEPPPGLSKGARKRWRKQQKIKSYPARSEASQETEPKSARSGSRGSVGLQTSGLPTKIRPKRAVVGERPVTQLMPKRKREWHDEVRHTANAKPNNGATKLKKSERPRQDDLSNDDQKSEHQAAPDSAEEGSSSASKSADPAGSKDQSVLSIKAQNYRSDATHSVQSARPSMSPMVGMNPMQRLAAPIVPMRRSSFGNRAISIPSFSSSIDATGSFKRFSEFLNQDDDTSGDDESEGGKAEVVVATQKVSQPEKAEFVDENDKTASETIQVEQNRIDNIPDLKEPVQIKPDQENEVELPRFSDSIVQPTYANGSSWPANVGIKRQTSLSLHEPARALSTPVGDVELGTIQLSTPVAAFLSDPFATNDDSQELLRTIDEVSSSVFGSTRPLPASKTPRTLDPGRSDQENGVLTSAHSGCCVTRSMSTNKRPPDHSNRVSDLIDAGAVTMDSNNGAGSSLAVQEQRHKQRPDVNEEQSESMSENIDVAIPGVQEVDSEAEETSSSLSELSRSPTPPVELSTVQSTAREDEHSNVTGAPRDDTDAAVSLDEPDSSPRKKRKMTGRTSKHFTPQKKKPPKSLRTIVRDPNQEINECKRLDPTNAEKSMIAATQTPLEEGQTPVQQPKRRTRVSLKVDDVGHASIATETVEQPLPSQSNAPSEQTQPLSPPPALSTRSSTRNRKSTGKKSTYFTPTRPTLDPDVIDRVDFYNTTTSGRKSRVPAGTSVAPVPPITAARFGIIQEKLWREPFWLLIAVTLLNQTTGRAAAPVFWALKERYRTAEGLAEAEQEDVLGMVAKLGLQNQRSKRMISIAKAWVKQPPVRGRRWRTLHYPAKGDGKEYKKVEVVEDDEDADADDCAGALEIGHIPGCGPYAWDSWRIFCRDVLRDVAEDYMGKGAAQIFAPEWQKVLPLDKELRACLRWMWLREGWIWNCEDGSKRRATAQEMEKALQGEMEIVDPTERKFAMQAAGVEVSPVKREVAEDLAVVGETKLGKDDDPAIDEDVEVEDVPNGAKPEDVVTPEIAPDEEISSDNIVVTPVVIPAQKPKRRSKRKSG